MKIFKFFLLSGLFAILACQSSDVVVANSKDFNSDVIAKIEGSNYDPVKDGVFSATNNQSKSILYGNFKFDKKEIKFEIFRGRKIGIMKELNPSFPEYEIDLRLLDKNDFPFFIQVGGHGPANNEWASLLGIDFAKSRAENKVIAEESFSLAKKMAKSLEKIKFKDDFSPEYEAITAIKGILEANFEKEGLKKSSNSLSIKSVNHMIQIWKKTAFFPGNIFGDHSGTVFRIYDNGVNYQIWSAANHGTAPGDPSMSLKCNGWFTDRLGFSEAPPMCATEYGFSSGQHVCNDDTYIQYQRIHDNVNPNTTSGTCSDNTLRRYAPSCW